MTYVAIATQLRQCALHVARLVPPRMRQAAMAFLQALRQLLRRDARQGRQPEDVQDHFANLHRLS